MVPHCNLEKEHGVAGKVHCGGGKMQVPVRKAASSEGIVTSELEPCSRNGEGMCLEKWQASACGG